MKKYQIDKIQFVWWWESPCFKWWAYPATYKQHESFHGKPMFWGLYLGIVEIRFFPVRTWSNEVEGNIELQEEK